MYRVPSDTPIASTRTPSTPDALLHPADSQTTVADTIGNATEKTDADVMANAHAIPNEDVLLNDASSWPWLASLSWDDILVGGGGNDSCQPRPDLQSLLDPGFDRNAAFFDAFPDLLGWGSTESSDTDALGPSTPVDQKPGPTAECAARCRHIRSRSSSSMLATDKNGAETGIAELSQLSTRLNTLLRSSCILAETARPSCQSRDQNGEPPTQLIDDVTFKSVAGWLVHVSADMNLLVGNGRHSPTYETTTGETLNGTFSASNHLLEILRYLQVSPLSGSPTMATTSTGAATDGFLAQTNSESMPKMPIPFEASLNLEDGSRLPDSIPSPSHYSNTVVRHLVIVCHTLLLNGYIAVLIALQHDADIRRPNYATGNVGTGANCDAAALTDIRLVLVVQICSYLIERQRQAVDGYLSPKSMMSFAQPVKSGHYQTTPPTSSMTNGELLTDLEREVQERLARLRQILRL